MAKATDIPKRSREAVHERDRGICRACGKWANMRALHHVIYRSQERNNHTLGNLVTLCGDGCHQMVHAHNQVFQPALLAIVDRPNMTAFAWLRRNGVDIRGLRGGSL